MKVFTLFTARCGWTPLFAPLLAGLLSASLLLTGCEEKPQVSPAAVASKTEGEPKTANNAVENVEAGKVAPVFLPANAVPLQPATEKLAVDTTAASASKPAEPTNDANDDGMPDDAHVFDIPEGDNGVLLQFIAEVPGRMLSAEDEETGGRAILAAAQRVLDNQPTEEQRTAAAVASLKWLQRLQAIYTQAAANQHHVWKLKLDEFAATKDPELAALLGRSRLLHQALGWYQLRQDQRDEFPGKLTEYFTGRRLDQEDLETAQQLGEAIYAADDRLAAVEIYRSLAELLQNSPDALVAGESKKLTGMAHRLESVGREVEIAGTLIGQEQLDWASYRGKVVLVDFWATWCGPCVAELPNIRKLYDIYHERGFDVIGVSLDTEEAELKEFIAKENIPWKVTFGYLADAPGMSQPLAVKFGINTVPVALLVDQEGRLISLEARGEELAVWLERLLGPADVSQAPEVETPAVTTDDTPAKKPEEKSAEQPSEKTEEKTEVKPAEKTEEKPESSPPGPSESKSAEKPAAE